jgi:hypothetical protein
MNKMKTMDKIRIKYEQFEVATQEAMKNANFERTKKVVRMISP